MLSDVQRLAFKIEMVYLSLRPSMPYNLFFSEVYSTVLAANPKVGQ